MKVEDSQGIYTEILEENRIMRELLKSHIQDLEVESLSAISIEDLKDKLKITGILLAEGMHNGIYYSGEEIEKMVNNFKDYILGMNMTVEHERTDEYEDDVVGTHDYVEYNPTIKAALYSSIIDNPKAIEDIKTGRFTATSMRLKERKVSVGDYTKAVDLRPMNNTLTQFPACSNCNVFHTEDLSLQYYGIKEEKEEKRSEEMSDLLTGEHRVQVIYTELKTFLCPKCKASFPIFQDYLEHWLTECSLEKKEKKEGIVPRKTTLSEDIEEHKATEGEINAMKTRCAKYPVSPKLEHGGHVTKPSEYANVPESMFADPCNFKYPMDDAHLRAAWAYSGKPENKSKGGYSDAEWSWMRNRIEKRMKATGHKVAEKSEEEEEYKEKTEECSECEEEMKRKRCPYCNELFDSISKHFPHCDVRKNTLSINMKCKYCEGIFNTEREFVDHLISCEKYNLSKEELSEESKKEVKEEPKEAPKEEVKETPKETPKESTEKKEEVSESKEKKPEEEESKEKEAKEEPKKEEVKEEKKEEVKEESKEEEAKIVTPQPKKWTKKELLNIIKKKEGDMLEKAATLIIERDQEKW